MKVKLDVSPDTTITVQEDDEGNVLSVTFEPMFTKKNGHVVLAYCTSSSDRGKLLDRFSLVVSGATGKVSKPGRTEAVVASVDEPGDATTKSDEEE